MLAVVDYGMGNLRSVANALDFLSVNYAITASPEEIRSAERLILPGVGAFGAAMKAIRERGLEDLLQEQVARNGKPVLGICLGMQLLAERSHEGGLHKGFGWIPGEVVRIETGNATLKVPHIGWTVTALESSCPVFAGLPATSDFYFLHSYTLRCDPTLISARAEYGTDITAAVWHNNVYGTQFHPEKSQMQGLEVLKNFANMRIRAA